MPRPSGRKARSTRVSIPPDVAQVSALLLDEAVDTSAVYATLGTYLSQIENPAYALKTVGDEHPALHSVVYREATGPTRMGFLLASGKHIPPKDAESKARKFLNRYWKNIVAEACSWWKDNKEKYVGASLIAGLAAAISPALPAPWNLLAPALAIIAVILVRSGLATLCGAGEKKPSSRKKRTKR